MDDVNVSVVAYNSGTTVQCKHCWLSGSLLKKRWFVRLTMALDITNRKERTVDYWRVKVKCIE